MTRTPLITEALGLGPIWQARPGRFAPTPQSWLDAPASPTADLQPALPPAETAADAAPLAQSALAVAPAAPAVPVDTGAMPATADAPRATPPDRAPAPPTALPDWEALACAVTGCERCRLSQTRTHAVFGRGSRTARWLLVGEAPGEQEDRQGLPFVGRAGQLLENMLRAAGLSSEQDVYIANVLKCRPPGNRNPAGDEIAACQDYLHQQIRHIRPGIIVALGRFAAQTLLETDQSISRLRGKVHQYQGIPLIVSYHPAYLLRNMPDKARAWQDWLFARRTLDA